MPFPPDIPIASYSGINLYLWYFAILLHVIGTMLLIIQANATKEVKSFRALLNAYASFVLGLGLNRVFFLWAYLTPDWTNYYLFLSIGYAFAAGFLVPVIFVLEKYLVQKTHFIFTILAVVLTGFSILSIFLPDDIESFRSLLRLGSMVVSLIWFILYFYIIKNTTGSPRTKAILIVVSVLIATIGFFLDAEMVLKIQIVPPFVAPICYIVGIILLVFVLTQKTE